MKTKCLLLKSTKLFNVQLVNGWCIFLMNCLLYLRQPR